MSTNRPDDVYACPFCMEKMVARHRYMPPTMGGPGRIISLHWVCVKGDGKGNRHTAEIERPYKESDQ